MFKELINEKVTVIVSGKGDTILEYNGLLTREEDNILELTNVDISHMMLNFQKGIFGGNINKYKENIEKVLINKRYIISCSKYKM
jgi:hypothetical protein